MPWSTPLDATIPVALSRADYDRTRRNFYLVTGAARDDERLPLLVPPGARAVPDPGAVLNYALLPGSASRERGPSRPAYDWVVPDDGGVVIDLYDFAADSIELSYTETVTPELLPSERIEAIQVSNPWTGEVTILRPGTSGWASPPDLAALRARSPGLQIVYLERGSQVWRSTDPYQVEHRRQIRRDWWYDTDWGREVVVVFRPPLVLGQYGWEPADATALPQGDPALPPLVAVPLGPPDQYVIGLPEPLFTVDLGSSSGMGDSGQLIPRPHGVYLSPVIYTGRGDRQAPRFYPRDDRFIAGLLPEGVPGIWMGHYEDVRHTEWYEDALEETIQTVARSAALSALVQVVGTYITAGGAQPFIQAALQQAAGQVQSQGGSAPSWSSSGDAAALAPTGAQGASGPLEASGLLPSTPSAPTSVLDATKQAPELTTSIAAPEQTNEVLAASSEALVYLDAMGSVQELWNMTIRELTVRAQRTREAADALRLRLAALEAEVHQQEWFRVTQQTVNSVMFSVVPEPVNTLVQTAVSAATAALQLSNALEVARALRQQLEAEMARLGREVNALDVEAALSLPLPTAPPPTPATARAREPWYYPILRWADARDGPKRG